MRSFFDSIIVSLMLTSLIPFPAQSEGPVEQVPAPLEVASVKSVLPAPEKASLK